MALTIPELKERLANNYDPHDIIELLELDTEELLAILDDKIEEHYDKLSDIVSDFEEEPDDDNRS